LVALLRRGDEPWRTEPLDGPPAVAAVAAADGAGGLAAASIGCDGAVALRQRGPQGVWSDEPTGLRGTRGARASLAIDPSGAAVVGVGGREAGVALREGPGAWRSLGLPGGPLRDQEAVGGLDVGIDPRGAPVALVARPRRLLRRLGAEGWMPAGGRSPAVAIAASGRSLAILGQDGRMDVDGPAGADRFPLRPLAYAVTGDGTLAYVLGGRAPVLGVGRPPLLVLPKARAVTWGARLRVTARLEAPGGPIAGASVAVAGARGTTDGAGLATLHPLVLRSGLVAARAAAPGPLPPVIADLQVSVLPRPSRLAGRVVARARRIVVRGRVAGGARLGERLDRVYLVDLGAGRRGFLPGRPLASTARRGAFTLRAPRRRGAHLALFYEGRVRRLSGASAGKRKRGAD
jgi:hypothetical protein